MPVQIESEEAQCGGLPVSFQTPNRELTIRACQAIKGMSILYAECGLLPSPDSHPFRMEFGVDIEVESCLGAYHCHEDLIRIGWPEQLHDLLDAGSAFYALESSELFDSLVVHEVTHALLQRVRNRPARSFAEDEYIAYSMQISALSPASRKKLLEQIPAEQRLAIQDLREEALMFSPETFAVSAWDHFASKGNGCAFVKRILEGKINFLN